MKNIFYKNIVALVLLTSCESHEQKSDEAFIHFKDEKMAIKDSVYIHKDTTIEKPQPTKKYEKMDEDVKFKKSIENSIHANELIIKKLKATPNMNIKTLKKIVHLEKVNSGFIKELANYDIEAKKKWQTFEAKINQEIKELTADLKNVEKN